MSALGVFGLVSVSLMLMAYALERRGRGWILVFARLPAGWGCYGVGGI